MKLEKLFIPSAEPGVRLELVIARPSVNGPCPTVVFNHGSTGRGQNRSLYSRTVAPAVVANHFVEQGWMAVFPQRRGRGKSGGAYGEGLAPDGSGYSCDMDIAIAGFERAVADVDAVVSHLHNRPDVDSDRLVIGGVSRGGVSCPSPMPGCGRVRSAVPSTSTAAGWDGAARPTNASIQCCSSVARPAGFRPFGCMAPSISTTASRIAEETSNGSCRLAGRESSSQRRWAMR